MNNTNMKWTETKEDNLEGIWIRYEYSLSPSLLLSVNQSCQVSSNQKVSWWWHISVLDNSENEIYHVSSKLDTYSSLDRCKAAAIDFATNQLVKKVQDKIENAQKEAREFTEILNVINGDE